MIRGVIFDMDGLMTDTEHLFLQQWSKVMKRMGYPEHQEIVRHCAGLNYPDSANYVREKLGTQFDYDGVLNKTSDLMSDYRAEHGIPVKPGLYHLMDFLDQEKIPYLVATTTEYLKARKRLEDIGVWERIRGVIAGDMVSRGKPDPEIYILACRQLSLPPENCLVLEDSRYGIKAAHLAGCLPVMIPDLHGPDHEVSPMLFALADSLDQVIPIIQRENEQ